MVNDDGNELVLQRDEKEFLLELIKDVIASPTEVIYQVIDKEIYPEPSTFI